MASTIFSCCTFSSSAPLARFSAVASLTMLEAPCDAGGGGGGFGQFTHLLCSASHGSCSPGGRRASAPWLRALVATGPSPRQLLHLQHSWALHWSHAPHRSIECCSGSAGGRLRSGVAGLGPGSSWSLFLSFLSILANFPCSLHLVSFAVCTLSGASPPSIFSTLQLLAFPSGGVFRALEDGLNWGITGRLRGALDEATPRLLAADAGENFLLPLSSVQFPCVLVLGTVFLDLCSLRKRIHWVLLEAFI